MFTERIDNNKEGTRKRMNEFENVATDITHSEQRGKTSTKKKTKHQEGGLLRSAWHQLKKQESWQSFQHILLK